MTRAALQGSLRELALADVLQLLDLGGRTGILRLHHLPDDLHGAILFADGKVRGAAVARAVADAEQRAASSTGGAVQEAVLLTLGWRHGEFSFVVLDRAPVAATAPALGVDALLMEAARRADEWAQVADVIATPDVVLALADGEEGGDMLELGPAAWALLAEIDGERTVRRIAAASGTEPVAVARNARTLVRAGLVVVLGPPRDEGAPPVVAAAGGRSS